MIKGLISGALMLIIGPLLFMAAEPLDLPVIAVKVYELPADELGNTFKQWQSLHVNAVFAPEDLLDKLPALRTGLTQRHMSLFLITPVFYNPQAIKEDPSISAICADGALAKDDWVEFVCPTHEGYRQRRIAEIMTMARMYKPEVISLDFIRHFAFWEMNSPDNPPKESALTCYCPRCMAKFMKDELNIGKPTVPGKPHQWLIEGKYMTAWRLWRIKQITQAVVDIVAAVHREIPDIRFNLHLVPWRHTDFDNAALNRVAQDAAALSKLVDYISPMCYSFMIKRPTSWIHEFCSWLDTQVDIPILPSIQVAKAYAEEEPALEAFTQAVNEAWKSPSSGIVFWNWEMLSRDSSKLEFVKAFIAGKLGL